MANDTIRFEWEITPDEAMGELFEEYVKAIADAIHRLALSFAPRVEAWMKQYAPWADRTGNARQTLYSEVERTLTDIAIIMDHGVDYGVWLELANQGNYQIIGPALDYWAGQFWGAVKDLFR